MVVTDVKRDSRLRIVVNRLADGDADGEDRRGDEEGEDDAGREPLVTA